MVVTRFAPSPTGYLHVGGARTALFNWLFARKMGGKFILRIEDTDTKRNTPTAAKQVMDDLRWLGIEWDEGPEIGGPNGPYLQSERRDIYDKYIKQLLEEGKAYYCFDTPQELQARRDKAAAEKKGFVYRKPENLPDEKDVENAKAEGKPVTVRLIVPQNEDIVVKDMVRGEVRFAAKEIADFIIRKSDGFPTYHFAVVVDDELMGVTHVIRGQEHLMNTPGHQTLQDALGFARPQYAHMSVTVSESGGKLSKRERPKALRNFINSMQQVDTAKLAQIGGVGPEDIEAFLKNKSIPDMPVIDAISNYLGLVLPEINVVDFFKSGYLPKAMVNFIALLGWNPGNNREVMKVDELINCFDISNLAKANSLFDRKKLVAFNTEHIKMADEKTILGDFKNYLKEIGSIVCIADDALLKQLIKSNAGARTLADIERKSRFLFVDNDKIEYNEKAVKKVLLKAGALDILTIIRQRLAEMEQFSQEGIEQMLRSLAQEKELGLGKVAQPLRVAICGDTISPPIFDSVNMLGKENTLLRIDSTLEKFNANSKT